MASSSKRNKEQSIIRNLDWFTLFIFVALVAMGWMSVCGASYDFEQGTQLLNFSSRSGMQMVWIVTSLMLGGLILPSGPFRLCLDLAIALPKKIWKI
jgi:rod shape determining protein RodA